MTETGWLIAVVPMIGGIALVGSVTAMLASWLVEQVTAEDDAPNRRLAAEVRGLADEVAALRGVWVMRCRGGGIAK